MKHKNNIRMLIVNVILPANLFISMVFLFIQVWYMEPDIEYNDLRAKRFLHEPLLEVLTADTLIKEDVPDWISFVALDSGEVKYMKRLDEEMTDWLNSVRGQMNFQKWIATLVQQVPDTVTLIKFDYYGQSGICMYRQDLLPAAFRILHRPVYIGNLFLLTMIFFSLGAFQMNSHYRNVKELIKASVRIRNMDLDTEIKSRRVTEMTEVFSAFDEMRLELKENRKRNSRFFMSVTHDLKTPLTAMRMYLEAISDGVIEDPDEMKEALAKVLIKTGVLEERINELLEFSRVQSSGINLKREQLGINSWIKDLSDCFKEECELNKRIYKSEIVLNTPVKISGNEKLLRRALDNLIDNGCRYTRQDDKIHFSCSVENNILNIVIEDSGPGVEPENRDLIFELFFRKDKGRNARGMGIGLTSVKSVMEDHGGSIICTESKLGGACFRIQLPVDIA